MMERAIRLKARVLPVPTRTCLVRQTSRLRPQEVDRQPPLVSCSYTYSLMLVILLSALLPLPSFSTPPGPCFFDAHHVKHASPAKRARDVRRAAQHREQGMILLHLHAIPYEMNVQFRLFVQIKCMIYFLCSRKSKQKLTHCIYCNCNMRDVDND